MFFRLRCLCEMQLLVVWRHDLFSPLSTTDNPSRYHWRHAWWSLIQTRCTRVSNPIESKRFPSIHVHTLGGHMSSLSATVDTWVPLKIRQSWTASSLVGSLDSPSIGIEQFIWSTLLKLSYHRRIISDMEYTSEIRSSNFSQMQKFGCMRHDIWFPVFDHHLLLCRIVWLSERDCALLWVIITTRSRRFISAHEIHLSMHIKYRIENRYCPSGSCNLTSRQFILIFIDY